MLQRVNIPNENSAYFNECWSLYNESFPDEEIRELWYEIETLKCKSYRFDAILDNGELIGLVGWWDLDSLCYIEHLATLPTKRNGGYGRKVLNMFKEEFKKGVILEVEHPVDELTTRRIEFYKREGFVLNHHHYMHPPYRGTEEVSLLIMSYPKSISLEELEYFKTNYFPLIHFRDR